MTRSEILNFVMAIHPHEHEEGVMRRWLHELEAKINCEIHRKPLCEAGTADSERLSVAAPYDKVYWTYLAAMLDLAAGNTEAYAVSDALFREAYEEYAKHVQRSRGRLRGSRW